jgi:hypothetical protein
MLPRWDELKTHGTGTPVTGVHDCFVLELTNILIGDVSVCVRLGEVDICVCLVELNLACPQVFDLFANWLFFWSKKKKWLFFSNFKNVHHKVYQASFFGPFAANGTVKIRYKHLLRPCLVPTLKLCTLSIRMSHVWSIKYRLKNN